MMNAPCKHPQSPLLKSPRNSRIPTTSGQNTKILRFHFGCSNWIFRVILALSCVCETVCTHHLEEAAVQFVNSRDSNRPLRISNYCPEVIYPAILTVSGVGPASSGFRLEPGGTSAQTVSADWRGRVWGRTNCTFDSDGSVPTSGQGGQACGTGDCGYFIQCLGAGNPPATLTEFTFNSPSNQAFYDLSLVDGYNLPVGIISLLDDVPPNLTNPVCIRTASLLAPIGDTTDATFGTNSSYPIPLEQTLTRSFVQNWCPWPLLLNQPSKPADGVYSYPDNAIQIPFFNPCFSTCAKYNQPQYCCTEQYNSPDLCKPSYYSIQAKKVCPDAYTYAFDDQRSTFTVPAGGGFEIVFCPAGRSSNILSTFGDKMRQVAQSGHMNLRTKQSAPNATQSTKSEASMPNFRLSAVVLITMLAWIFVAWPTDGTKWEGQQLASMDSE